MRNLIHTKHWDNTGFALLIGVPIKDEDMYIIEEFVEHIPLNRQITIGRCVAFVHIVSLQNLISWP